MNNSSSKKSENLFAFETDDELHVCEAVLDGDEIRVHSSVCLSLDAEELAENSSSALQAKHFNKKEVTIVLQRRDVSLRLFELPALQADEIHDYILLQAETRIGRSFEESYYDYLTISGESSEAVAALFVSTQRSRLDRIKDRLQKAGFQATSAMVPELSLPGLSESDGLCLDILLRDGISEIVVSDAGVVVTTKSCKLPHQPDQLSKKVFANWSLLQAGLPALLQARTLREVRLHAVCAEVMELEPIKERFPAANVKFGKLNQHIQHLEITTLLLDPRIRQKRIDFIQPRKKISSRLSRHQVAVRVAAVTILILTSFSSWIYSENAYLNQQIDSLTRKQNELSQLIEHGQSTLEKKQSIDEWSDLNVDWTSEIQKFSDFLPSNERVYLTRLQVDVSTRSGAAVLRVSGKARENADVTKLNRRLVTESTYEMHPVTIHPSTTDGIYQAEFEFEAELNREEMDSPEAG